MKRFIILILFIIAFSFIQFLDITFFGVKPNFAIAIIVAASFFIYEIWEGIFVISLSSFILKFSPYLDKEIFVFFIVGVLVMLLRKFLPWNHLVNNFFLVFTYTALFYLLLFPWSIISIGFLKEIFYNIILGIAIFWIFSWIIPKRPSLL